MTASRMPPLPPGGRLNGVTHPFYWTALIRRLAMLQCVDGSFTRHIDGCLAILRHCRLIAWESLDADAVDESVHKSSWLITMFPFEDRLADSEELQALLASLELEDAACLILKFVQGYSAVELAQILWDFRAGCPQAALTGASDGYAPPISDNDRQKVVSCWRMCRPRTRSEQDHDYEFPAPTPAPTPLCALYEPMSPLLLADELNAEQTVSVRGHLSGCPLCSNACANSSAWSPRCATNCW